MNNVLIAMLLLVGFTSMAQRGERGEKGQRENYKDMTAEQIATLHTKKMTLHLDLNEDQQRKIQALNLESAKKRKAKMAERKAAKEDGERKKPSSDEMYEMKNARLDAAIAHKAALKEILTPEQYSKWETSKKKGKHKMRKQAKERKGHKKQ